MTTPPTLKIFAALFAVVAVTNLFKPFRLLGDETGFVLFGTRLTGSANAVAGPLFGVFLLVYARLIFTLHPAALPVGIAYAVYVAINLVLFYSRAELPGGLGYMIFGAIYAAVAIGVSTGAVWALLQMGDELR